MGGRRRGRGAGAHPGDDQCDGRLAGRPRSRRQAAGVRTRPPEERLGLMLVVLHDRMAELCDRHGLTLEDLNLDLGPLGPLLPPP
ncbi:gas vesicle protein GvpK [Streptomyces broussonetiae]|uniref:Gas vesicle protein GvpK n=1 Tax=Streptomyces broussonetiae TaxID=2686304 RepID=A0ABV5E829_9ACTN